MFRVGLKDLFDIRKVQKDRCRCIRIGKSNSAALFFTESVYIDAEVFPERDLLQRNALEIRIHGIKAIGDIRDQKRCRILSGFKKRLK